MRRPQEIEEWDIETLQEVIQIGENNWFEFKSILEYDDSKNNDKSQSEWRHSLESEFTAFANAEGGSIIFGVSDEGNQRGITRPEEGLNAYFNNLISDINPPLAIDHQEVLLTDDPFQRYAVIVNVHESNSKPVQTSRASYYIRINEAAQPMNREMVQTMFLRSQEQFNARRDLEIELEQFSTVYSEHFSEYSTDSEEPPEFSLVKSEAMREAINRFLRYGDIDWFTRHFLKNMNGAIDELVNLRERFLMYSKGDTVAFEYGRGEIAKSSADFRTINRGAREDLKEITDLLYEQVELLNGSQHLDFEI